MMIADIRVTIEKGSLSAEEATYFIDKLKATSKFELKKVSFSRTESYLDIRCAYKDIPFERIRRVPFTRAREQRVVNH